MKHLLLYENYEDDLPDMARDLFDLQKSFNIVYEVPVYGGSEEDVYAEIKGPSENYHLALPIMQELQKEVTRMEDNQKSDDGRYISSLDISDLIWDLKLEKPLNDLGFYFYYDGKKFIPDRYPDS